MTTSNPCHPGTILKERFLDPLGITPYRLAKCVGVPTRRISELVKGKRRISTDTAIRLGLFFNVPPAWWLDMQAGFDIKNASRLEDLRARIAPYQALEDVLVTPKGVRRLERSRATGTGALLVRVSDELLRRLTEATSSELPRACRELRTVTYSNGATALVGSSQ